MRDSDPESPPPIRVLYILHTGAASGAGLSLRYLLERFRPGEVEATALVPPGPIAEQLRGIGIEVRPIAGVSMFVSAEGIPLRGLRLLELMRTAWHCRHGADIRRAIAEVQPDIVHLNDRGMLHAARVAHRAGVPVVMHARSVADTGTRWVARVSAPLIRRNVDRVIAIDESVRRSLPELESVRVIYNPYAVEADAILPAPEPRTGRIRATYLTGLLGFKGIWDLLEAALLLRERRDIEFVIAGSNSRPEAFHRSLRGKAAHLFGFAPDVERAVRQWVARHQLSGTVRLLGQVSRVSDVLRDSDMLVFPSHLNGPGRAVFEAGVYGIPSIVALKDRVEDVIAHDVTGLIVPPRDPRRLADAIVRLADDPALRRRLGDEARRRYVTQFDPDGAARAMLAVYRELSASRRTRMATVRATTPG